MSQTYTIRWLLQHEPVELFLRTAKAFDTEIKALTHGRISVETYTQDEYAQINKNYIPTEFADPLLEIKAGQIEMSQVQVGQVGYWFNPEFYALEMPYLFESHDHATRVLEGPIGKKMLQNLETTSPTTGLAFTYSGGYRVLASKTPVQTAEDLKGLTCLTERNPIRVDTARAFGFEVVPALDKSTDRKELYAKSTCIETTLPRYENEAHVLGQNYIADTAHSMYLTTILVGNDFWAKLSKEDQQAMRTAAERVATLERQWSVDDAEKLATDTEKHAKLGIHYTELPDAEKTKLKQLVKPVYDKYTAFFAPGFIDGIING
jgi:TRAP-type C4-dicarboxylate transport system substrate-binding protein